jgi:Tol biopolymer transport system component
MYLAMSEPDVDMSSRKEKSPEVAPVTVVADSGVETLGKELSARGWLLFAGHPAEIDKGELINDRNVRGPTDLYLCRPDGSDLRAVTRTADYSEYGGKFSRDGKKMLYRRQAVGREISHDQWGESGELVLADADGSNPVVQGKEGEYPWATWSPDGKEIACLYKQDGKIRIYDLAMKKVIKEMPAQGIYQQFFWSPDGKRLVGTANLVGGPWNIVSMDIASEKVTQLSRAAGSGGNCTPDWFQKDARQVIYSSRFPELVADVGGTYGFTWLMRATADGRNRKMVFARMGKHIYFGCTSPDDKYLVCADDPGDGFVAGEMRIARFSDTPIVIGLKELEELYPGSKHGPVFDLRLPNGVPLRGFEPDWTYAEVAVKKKK